MLGGRLHHHLLGRLHSHLNAWLHLHLGHWLDYLLYHRLGHWLYSLLNNLASHRHHDLTRSLNLIRIRHLLLIHNSRRLNSSHRLHALPHLNHRLHYSGRSNLIPGYKPHWHFPIAHWRHHSLLRHVHLSRHGHSLSPWLELPSSHGHIRHSLHSHWPVHHLNRLHDSELPALPSIVDLDSVLKAHIHVAVVHYS